jgi:hypothetical protein
MAFKQNRGGKLLLLDWDQRTKFIRDGKSTPAAELSPGKEVVVVYRYISFHNPTLLEVSWAGGK